MVVALFKRTHLQCKECGGISFRERELFNFRTDTAKRDEDMQNRPVATKSIERVIYECAKCDTLLDI